MSMYVSLKGLGQDAMLEWARERVGNPHPWPAHALALGIYQDDTLRGVVVSVETYEGIIDMHFATDESRLWANRSILSAVFGYMFDFREAHRLQTWHPAAAKRTTSLVLRLGFTVEGTIRAGIDLGEDAILFSMLRDDCPWLSPNGQQKDT